MEQATCSKSGQVKQLYFADNSVSFQLM